MRHGRGRNTVWPGESMSVVLPQWTECSMGVEIEDSRTYLNCSLNKK